MQFEGLKSKYPGVPILALTGSMNPSMIQDYVNFIGIENCLLVQNYPDRPNIYYRVIPLVTKEKVVEELIRYVNRYARHKCSIFSLRKLKRLK